MKHHSHGTSWIHELNWNTDSSNQKSEYYLLYFLITIIKHPIKMYGKLWYIYIIENQHNIQFFCFDIEIPLNTLFNGCCHSSILCIIFKVISFNDYYIYAPLYYTCVGIENVLVVRRDIKKHPLFLNSSILFSNICRTLTYN